MKEASVHLLLCSFFAWHLQVREGGLPPINILHRISTEGHAGRQIQPGHKILCPEMSSSLRKVQAAFNTLDVAEKIVCITKHMPPPLDAEEKPLYKNWGDKEKADYLNENITTYKSIYRRCLRKMKKRL